MEEPEDSLSKDRILFEGFPALSVFEVDLGHLPFVLVRFESQEDSETGLDFIVTVGGGSPLDVKTTAEFLRETAELLEAVADEPEIDDDKVDTEDEEPEEWGTTLF